MKTSNEDEKPGAMEKEETSSFIRGIQWLTLKLKLLDKGATPPNWKQILLVFACLFASSCSLTFLFPFLPEMILHFGYSETEKGTYGGFIASSLFAGRIFGSMFWGWLADRRGRKTVICLCLILTGVSAGLFGFSVNIYMATTLRFLCGLVNGVVGTAKAALYDVSDNTNQALGMTMLSLAWGMGMVTGPLLGGVLATPCTKWPDFCDQDSLFGKFPFLLPSLFPCIVSILVFILLMFKMDETFASSSGNSESEPDSQEEDQEDEKVSKLHHTRKSTHHHHLLVQRSFSHNEENQTHQPIHGILSRSVISLCPEAEMSISLGKEVLHRQESVEQTRRRIRELALSEPDLPLSKGQGFNQIMLDMNSGFSKSTSHVIPNDSTNIHAVMIKPQNGSVKSLNNEGRAPIYRLNSETNYNHKYPNGTILTQPMAVLSVEDEKKAQSNGNNMYTVTVTNYNTQQPLLPSQAIVVKQEEEEAICKCCDSVFSLCCTNSGIHKLLRLSDIWETIILYTNLSFVTIGVDDIFPMFASTRPDLGGLGFTTNEIGMALGLVTLPLLFLQIKVYPFLVSKLSIRKTFILMSGICMVASQSIPMLRALNNNPTWLWVFLVLIQLPFKIAANCCFASTSLLINNSAPQELAGQANGLSMTTTAIGRTIAPIVAGLLFSWSVTYGQFIGAPFDIGFPFFVMGAVYGVCVVECIFVNPRLDKQKK